MTASARTVDLSELSTAVAQARSWRGALRLLGFNPANGRAGRLLKQRCDEAGVGYEHFTGGRSWTDDQLHVAVSRGSAWSDVMEMLGFAADSGSARESVRRHAARLGVTTAHLDRSHTGPPARAAPFAPEQLRRAGTMIVAAVLTLRGMEVAWPLEPAVYDLMVCRPGDGPERIQVKTTTQGTGATWVCHLTRGQRRSYGPEEIDAFGIVTGDMHVYLIPHAAVAGRVAIHLSRYADFLIGVVAGPVAA